MTMIGIHSSSDCQRVRGVGSVNSLRLRMSSAGDDEHHHGLFDVESLGDVGDDRDPEQGDRGDEREPAPVGEAPGQQDQGEAEQRGGAVRELADVRGEAGGHEMHSRRPRSA